MNTEISCIGSVAGAFGEIALSDWVLLTIGTLTSVAVSTYTGFVIGRFLMFRQLVGQALSEYGHAHMTLKPMSLDDQIGVIFEINNRVHAVVMQLFMLGHVSAADMIKHQAEDASNDFYVALRHVHSEFSNANQVTIERVTILYKKWLTLRISNYTAFVSRARCNVRSVLFGSAKQRASYHVPELDSFKNYYDKKGE